MSIGKADSENIVFGRTDDGLLSQSFRYEILGDIRKVLTGVVDTGGHLDLLGSSQWCSLTCECLLEFSNKFEMTLVLFSGAWGKMIHEKI
jgi:hypothetical protein